MAGVPDKFDAVVEITLDGQSIIVGDFSPSPISTSWLCWISYCPDKEFAFNTALKVDFRLRVPETQSGQPYGTRIACRGSINLMEGCMKDIIVSKPSQNLINWLQERYQSDPIQSKKVERDVIANNLLLVKMNLKVKELIHNNNFRDKIPNSEQSFHTWFNYILRQEDNQEKKLDITLVVKITQLGKKLTYDFYHVLDTFCKRNTDWNDNPSGKARRFYNKEHSGNILGSSHEYIIAEIDRTRDLTSGATNLYPVIDHQYWPARAIAQADVQALEDATVKSSRNFIVMLNLARYKAGTKEEYWFATGVLPENYPVCMEDFPEILVKWMPEENGTVYPKKDWKASIIPVPPWKQGLSVANICLRLRNPAGNRKKDEGEDNDAGEIRDPLPPYFLEHDDNTTSEQDAAYFESPARNRVTFGFQQDVQDFKKKQLALQILNPFDTQRQPAAVDLWNDVHVGYNLDKLRRPTDWFGTGYLDSLSPVKIGSLNNQLGKAYKIDNFQLTEEQLQALKSFTRCPQQVNIIHGLAGTTKTTVIGILIGLASRHNYRFALCAAEHYTVDNSVAEISAIVYLLSGKSVLRWYTFDDCIKFLQWRCNGQPVLPYYSDLLTKNPDSLTDLQLLQLAYGKSLDVVHGVPGGKFRLPQYHPVFTMVSDEELAHNKSADYELRISDLMSIMVGPEIEKAVFYERSESKSNQTKQFNEAQARRLLAQTMVREQDLEQEEAPSLIERTRRQLATIMLDRHKQFTTSITNEIKDRMEIICQDSLKNAALVCGTPFRLWDEPLQKTFSYDVVIIEEASSVNDDVFDTIIAARPEAKAVLIGDIYQPGPFVPQKSKGEVPKTAVNMKTSMLKKLIERDWPRTVLNTNFRGVRPLTEWISQTFYESKLLAGLPMDKVRDASSTFQQFVLARYGIPVETTRKFPLLFLNARHTQESSLAGTSSSINNDTVPLVRELSAGLSQQGISNSDQLILTPYLGQVKNYRSKADPAMLQRPNDLARVMTVTSANGYAAEIVFLDLVKTKTWGFVLRDYKLERVLTRARTGVIVVANWSELLKKHTGAKGKFRALVDSCRNMGMFKDI